jgi:hypothetical protein
MTTTQLVLAALIPLVLWRLYSRLKRFIGRQRSRLWRHMLASIFFPSMAALFALLALHDPLALSALAAGTVAGGCLALWALKLTTFEQTGDDFHYTPNARIGIAIALVFIARILYRAIEIFAAGGIPPTGQQDFARSPLTLLVFGLLAGYYAVYASGLIRWRLAARGVEPAGPVA